MKGTVYLLHFDQAYKHARHYLGWTSGTVDDRLELHRTGKGSRLMEIITNAGISFQLVRSWRGSRGLEKKLKCHQRKNLCPVCSPESWKNTGKLKSDGRFQSGNQSWKRRKDSGKRQKRINPGVDALRCGRQREASQSLGADEYPDVRTQN